MPTLRQQQARFTSGELDPEMVPREDTRFYYAGARRLRDAIPQARGGVKRRPASRYVATLTPGQSVRLFGFAFATEQTYMHLIEPESLRVFLGRTEVATVPLPYLDSQLSTLNRVQSADTLLLFHPDHPPRKVMRQGGDSFWASAPLALANIPRFDYGGTNTSGTMTPSHTDGPNRTMTASVGTFTDQMIGWEVRGNAGVFRITAFISAVSVTGDVRKDFTDTSAIAEGEWSLGEPVISARRGWPRCGAFHQERLHLSGLRSRPPASIMSKTAEFFDFDDRFADEADSGALFVASADQVNAVYQINGGRHLQQFTGDAEFFQLTEPLTPKAMALRQTTNIGAIEGVPVLNLEGAVFFVSAGDDDEQGGEPRAATIREFLFSEAEQSYLAQDVSLLSAHLVRDPRDAALKKPAGRGEPHRCLWVNRDDGTLLLLTTNRAQKITGFTLHNLGGRVQAVGVEPRGPIWFVVDREIAGTTRRTLEVWDESLYLDGAVERVAEQVSHTAMEGQAVFAYGFASPATAAELVVDVDGLALAAAAYTVDLQARTVTLATPTTAGQTVRLAASFTALSGLDHFEAAEVHLYQDGSPAGTAVVTGGSVALPEPCRDRVHAGLNFEPWVKTMPLAAQLEDGTQVGEIKRVVDATIGLQNSAGFSLAANDGPRRPVYLQPPAAAPGDHSQQETLFSGLKVIKGLKGWSRTGQVEIVQEEPGPLHITSLILQVQV